MWEDKGREVIGSDLKVMGNKDRLTSSEMARPGVAFEVSRRNRAIGWVDLLGAVK